MARDPKANAMHRLFVAKANYDLAVSARKNTRDLMNTAMMKAAAAGISKAEIARIVDSSAQRVGQIIAEHDGDTPAAKVKKSAKAEASKTAQGAPAPLAQAGNAIYTVVDTNTFRTTKARDQGAPAPWAQAGLVPLLPSEPPKLTGDQRKLLHGYLQSPKYRAGRHVAADVGLNPDKGGTIAAQLCRLGLLRRGNDKHLDAQGHRTLVTYSIPAKRS